VSDDEDSGYVLLMPFVLSQSNGGPYDDKAFAAGMTCGQFWAELETVAAHGALPRPRYVRPEYIPQLDLIAMHFGYTLTAGDTDSEPGWQRIDFGPQHPQPEGTTQP